MALPIERRQRHHAIHWLHPYAGQVATVLIEFPSPVQRANTIAAEPNARRPVLRSPVVLGSCRRRPRAARRPRNLTLPDRTDVTNAIPRGVRDLGPVFPPGVFIGSDGDECALLDDCGKRTGSIIAQAQELMKAKGIAPQRLKMAALCSVCAELAILEHSGSTVEDRGNHLIVRAPDNPDFH
jgi:hypothetical protein